MTLKSTSGLGGRTRSFFSPGSSVKTYVTIKSFILSRGKKRKKCFNLKKDADLERMKGLSSFRCAKLQDPRHQRRARSDVGPLINEHAAAGEGSVHFGLLPVCYRDQHVVLKFLKNLQEKQPYHLYNVNAKPPSGNRLKL